MNRTIPHLTQTQFRVLTMLMSHKSGLTKLALDELSTQCHCPARIKELREMGFEITSTLVENHYPENKRQIVTYSLHPNDYHFARSTINANR